MKKQFTREPSFYGNTGYNGNAQQSRGVEVLPINKRGGNKGNTYLYTYISPVPTCCRFQKAATGCQKKYQLNQWCYRCCHVARIFENSQGNIRGRKLVRWANFFPSLETDAPSWQADLHLTDHFPLVGRWLHRSTRAPKPNVRPT